LSIPLDLCMTKDTAIKYLNDGLGGAPTLIDPSGRPPILPSTNEYLAIAVFLIYEAYVHERITGNPSFWKPYLDVLPTTEDVGCTWTWTDEDISSLSGSPVLSATESMKIKLRKEYEAMITDPLTGVVGRFPSHFKADDFTYERWEWAFTMLFSRAIRLRNLKEGETVALVPYADLINHSPFSQAFVDAREQGDWLFKTGVEEVILYADRGFRKMEQIYISYGQKGNADLLLLYGFALERNPFNSVDVSVNVNLDDEDVLLERKVRLDDILPPSSINSNLPLVASLLASPIVQTLFRNSLRSSQIEFLKRAGRDGIIDFPIYADRYPVEMLEYLRLMLLTSDDLGGRELEDFDYSRTISSMNEALVLSSIIYACESQLSKYPTTEKEDITVIEDKGMFRLLTKNARMAVRHRRNEKRLLARTIAALRKEMTNRGLDVEGTLTSAEGETDGVVLEGDEKKFQRKGRSRLERTLDKMGLPVDIR